MKEYPKKYAENKSGMYEDQAITLTKKYIYCSYSSGV